MARPFSSLGSLRYSASDQWTAGASIDTTLYRLKKLFNPVASLPLAALTPSQAEELFSKLTDWSVDTRRNTLAEAKTFCHRAKTNRWTEADLLDEVEGEGKRKRGKAKLTKDEPRSTWTSVVTWRPTPSRQRQLSQHPFPCCLATDFRGYRPSGQRPG